MAIKEVNLAFFVEKKKTWDHVVSRVAEALSKHQRRLCESGGYVEIPAAYDRADLCIRVVILDVRTPDSATAILRLLVDLAKIKGLLFGNHTTFGAGQIYTSHYILNLVAVASDLKSL